MRKFLIIYRHLYWTELLTFNLDAYTFGEAETKFIDSIDREIIIIKIELI